MNFSRNLIGDSDAYAVDQCDLAVNFGIGVKR